MTAKRATLTQLPIAREAERLARLGPALLAVADDGGRLLHVNPAWTRLLGWTDRDVVGGQALELLHPDDRERAAVALAAAGSEGRDEAGFEARTATRDGGWAWISWRVRAEDGSWYWAGQDTRERHLAELEREATRARLAEAQRVARVGSFEHDLASGQLWWSEEHYRIYGIEPGDFEPTTRAALGFVHPDDVERVTIGWRDLLSDTPEGDGTLEFRVLLPDGGERWVLTHGRVIFDERGAPRSVLGTVQDVTTRRVAELALGESEGRLRALVEQVPAIVYTAGTGAEATWDYVSPQIEAMLGYTAAEWMADPKLWFAAMHPDDRERTLDEEAAVSSPGAEGTSEYRLRRRDGSWVWVRDESRSILGADGQLRFQGVLTDITDQKLADQARAASEERYRNLVQTSEDIIWSVDPYGRFTFVNDAVRHVHGYEPEEMIGRPFTDFQSPEVAARDRVVATEVLAGREVKQYETEHLRRDGTPIALSFNAVLMRDGAGKVIGTTGTARDVTAQKRAARAVREKHGQLQAIIDNSPLAVFAKDLDGNYLLANSEWEEVLGAEPGAVIGGGDESCLPPPVARVMRSDDAQVLENDAPVETERVLPVHGRELTYLIHRFPLRDAEGSVYGVCGIATDITERKAREDALRAKVEWAARIREAIRNDRLVLHAQPIVELASGKVAQEELLLRMLAEDGEGLIMPDEFLPPAERFGLAPAIDRWVVRRAVRMACDRRVEVNLSGQSIGDPGLTTYIESEIRAAGADPSNLVFEITETAAAEDIPQARCFAERLGELGCHFALDDFGTGYGSFTYLKHLPVSYIKIDVEFVRNVEREAADRQVVRAIVDVARNFGIETIAEGVESQESLNALAALGVDYVQGYHVGAPAAP